MGVHFIIDPKLLFQIFYKQINVAFALQNSAINLLEKLWFVVILSIDEDIYSFTDDLYVRVHSVHQDCMLVV